MHQPESRIELTCIAFPDDHDQIDTERKEETLAQWEKATDIAHRFAIHGRTEDHREGDTEYGDAYLYPSLETLEQVLTSLEQAGVGFDNIDLPNYAPTDLIARLQQKYGVMVNEGEYP
jgi:hypothetical protein